MNILITGIHGFVGSNLVVALKERHSLYGLDIVAPEKEIKPYKEQEPMVPNVGEPVVVYTGNENNPNIVTEGRDDIRHAISGEELLDRLCPRIKALFG